MTAVDGVLSAGQLAAIRTMVTRPVAELFHERQQNMLDNVNGLPVAATQVACQAWREYAEAIVDMPEPVVPQRSWRSARAGDGSLLGGFVSDSVGAAEIEQALNAARRPGGADDARSTTTRNADAVVEIMSFFNANHIPFDGCADQRFRGQSVSCEGMELADLRQQLALMGESPLDDIAVG